MRGWQLLPLTAPVAMTCMNADSLLFGVQVLMTLCNEFPNLIERRHVRQGWRHADVSVNVTNLAA